ncbi:AAA family ATPase [Thermocaproicibacter melissae]|uniref:AAA family ATPase n=1 Tax=Thermocaproicibacter melissae TaxID=2966552 RepID=UPI0024B0AFC4|nr:AAA family ATPase [Thermocaproicibacter melissae]WBY64710.1 AAA family ATPase [Thermocaproicibacter melissae]
MEQLIAVTGNSGKTVFSFYLAQILSKQGKRVFLVSTDSHQPAFKMLFPDRKDNDGRSLGRLLSLATIAEANIFNNAHTINKNLMLLSYADGETALTYPEIAKINLESLFQQLSIIADIILIDTSTHQNKIDKFALSKCSKQISIATADVKGYYYRQNHPNHGCALQVLFVNNPNNALADVLSTYDSPVTVLPYCRGLSGIYNGICITDIIPPRKYRKTLYRIVGELL